MSESAGDRACAEVVCEGEIEVRGQRREKGGGLGRAHIQPRPRLVPGVRMRAKGEGEDEDEDEGAKGEGEG